MNYCAFKRYQNMPEEERKRLSVSDEGIGGVVDLFDALAASNPVNNVEGAD